MKTKKTRKVYYFGYASNLRHQQMRDRCPHSNFVGRAKLGGWRLIFCGYSKRWGGGVASIVPDKDYDVWGGLFELDKHCRRRLDYYERTWARLYRRKAVEVKLLSGEKVSAYTYEINKKTADKISQPSYKYYNQIKTGAIECGIDQVYIDSILAESAKKLSDEPVLTVA